MAYTKTTWADRVVQYPNKYKDQDLNEYTFTRDEGTVTEAGTLFNATNMNNIEDGIENVDTRITTAETDIDGLQVGWLPAGETWTYSSVDDPTGVITIAGDVTTKYSVGMRIKFTNGGNVIFGIVSKTPTYSSPNTTLTFLHEIDPTDSLAKYLMANSAITANYYSTMKAPYGFPVIQSKWSITKAVNSNDTGITARTGKTAGSIVLPIGCWNINVNGYAWWDSTANVAADVSFGFGTTQNTEATISKISYISTTNSAGEIRSNAAINLLGYEVAAKTTLYNNVYMYLPNATYASQVFVTNTAVCAYL